MVALYLTSSTRGSGRTTIGAGLGKHLLDDGKKVGFFKPMIADRQNQPAADGDAAFMKSLFALDEPVDLLCPVFSDTGSLTSQIKTAYARVSQGKDVVIVEGISEQPQASREIVAAVNARVIIVEEFSQLKATNNYKDWAGSLLGVVLNKVPVSRLEAVRGEVSARLAQARVNLLGVLPEDRTLFTLTVGELAERIQGEFLRGAEQSAELVENIMLGANCLDPGREYFARKANKAVVVSSDRPDMALAALETSTRCLVLTGNTAPYPYVPHQAEAKNVPVILAKNNTIAIVTSIEDALGKTQFSEENKLPRLTEIMEQHFDFPALYRGLGLGS